MVAAAGLTSGEDVGVDGSGCGSDGVTVTPLRWSTQSLRLQCYP